MSLAIALFDNESEWADELAFRKGDKLHIVDSNPAQGSAQGWWVCCDALGRRGIAPANRLKLLHENLEIDLPNFVKTGPTEIQFDEERFSSTNPNSIETFLPMMESSFRRNFRLPDFDDHLDDSNLDYDQLFNSDFGKLTLLHDANNPIRLETYGSSSLADGFGHKHKNSPIANQNNSYRSPVVRHVPIIVEEQKKSINNQLINQHQRSKLPPSPPPRSFAMENGKPAAGLPLYDAPVKVVKRSNGNGVPAGLSKQHRTVRFADEFSDASSEDQSSSSSLLWNSPPVTSSVASSSNDSTSSSARSSDASTANASDTYDVPKTLKLLFDGLQRSGLQKAEPTSAYDDYDFVDQPKSIVNNSGQQENGENDDILKFYGPQIDQQLQMLNGAIQEFLESIEQNAAPRVFVARGRFVVLAAHKLVYLGDSAVHCLKSSAPQTSSRISQICDRLCDALKLCVKATRQASEAYPCVESMQRAVSTVVSISEDAHKLRLLIN